MFFRYWQNNSGGSFEHDPAAGIGYFVFVEADNDDQANSRAKEIGIYFDGADEGYDCDCCGDRWSRAWDSKPDGYDVLIEPPTTVKNRYFPEIKSYIHYKDGRIVQL